MRIKEIVKLTIFKKCNKCKRFYFDERYTKECKECRDSKKENEK